MVDDACSKLRGAYLSIVNGGISPLSLNPSTSIKVFNSIMIPKALYGCELWTSMSAEDKIKLERSHRICLKHIQGLPQNTATNFSLCAIHAVPMETKVDYRKLVFLGQLCNLPNTYMAKHLFNSRLVHYGNFDKQHHCFIPTSVRYCASTNFTTLWISTLQKACSWRKVCGKPCSGDMLHKKRNLDLLQECLVKYSFLGSTILRSDGVCALWNIARNNSELSSLCSKTVRVIGRLTMPAYLNTCALWNELNSNIVHHRILLCNANSNTREQLWNTILDTNGLSGFNQMCRSCLSEQCNNILRMFLDINYDNFIHTRLSSLVCKMFSQ
ncbi:hypothetical protein DPMN_152305 [Dreissena polymorpha]|uniref:Uncharacterized protein n=1 Tax=Dreissena polymorpha TaxID=45954 RepID=A0A9D4FK60_DREPO|nr:hypothetical protein DPMN_152305 [Dreissena polymorpha]